MDESEKTKIKQLSVLLAEDNPVNQEVISEMLSSIGCRVEVVCNGEQALEASVNQKFELILMDCQMPVMNGHEAVRQIRLHERSKSLKRVPVIGITGRAVQGNYEKCMASGMDDYLDKPFTIERLREAVFLWTRTPLPASTEPQTQNSRFFDFVSAEGSGDNLLQCLDKTTIKNICALKQGFPGILEKLVHIFLRDSPGKFLEIRKGIYEKNPELICQASHSLKSSSANLGALALASVCHELEMGARSRSIEGARLKLEMMESEYVKVAAALKSIVETPYNEES